MFKSGFVSIIGRPNAGKSTLINALVGSKIAIMTNKPQTTRNIIRGIRTDKDSQIIFIDTPGIHKPKHELGRTMNQEAFSSLSGADLVYYLIDATAPFGKGDAFVVNQLSKTKMPVFLVINKVDLIDKGALLALIEQLSKVYTFAEVIPISALQHDNMQALLTATKQYLTDSIQYYPDDQISDYPEQFIIAEIIREKIIQATEEEIPHSIAVVIEKIVKRKDNLIINALILVDRDSQKGIIIGKQGQMVKQIGTKARTELEYRLGNKVYLELYVRVEKNWRNRKAKLLQLGYIEPVIE